MYSTNIALKINNCIRQTEYDAFKKSMGNFFKTIYVNRLILDSSVKVIAVSLKADVNQNK